MRKKRIQKNSIKILYFLFFAYLLFISYHLFFLNTSSYFLTEQGLIESVRVGLDLIEDTFISLPLSPELYFINLFDQAQEPTISSQAENLYLFILIIALAILLALITNLKRFTFLFGITVLIFYVTNLKLELLLVFSKIDVKFFPYLCLFCLLSPSIVFHFFKNKVKIENRILFFLIILALLFLIGYHFNEVVAPITIITQNSFLIPIVLTCLFGIFFSIQLYQSILLLITNTEIKNRQNKTHIIIIFSLFLLNSIYCFLFLMRDIDLGIYYLHPFAWLLVNFVLGIWKKELGLPIIDNIFKNIEHKKIFFIGWGLLVFGTILFYQQTLNDPIIEALEDILLGIFLSMGVFFFIYIIVVHNRYLSEGKNIYKMIVSPSIQMNYFYNGLFIATIISTIILLGMHGFNVYSRLFAGYYTNQAEVYRAQKNEVLSRQYWTYAISYIPNTHKANYLLACSYKKNKETNKALYFFLDASSKNPQTADFLQIESIFFKKEKYEQAIDILQKGLETFPQSTQLLYRMGRNHEKLKGYAKAKKFFITASSYDKNYRSQANELAFSLRNNYFMKNNYMNFSEESSLANIATMNNWMVLEKKQNKTIRLDFHEDFLKDTILNTVTLAYLYNYIVCKKNIPSEEQKILISKLNTLQKIKQNSIFSHHLRFAEGMLCFKIGDNKRALEIWKLLNQETAELYPFYSTSIGYLLLQLEDYPQASYYFKRAQGLGDREADYFLAYSQLWSGSSEGGNSMEERESYKKIIKTHNNDKNNIGDFLSIPFISQKPFLKEIEKIPSQKVRKQLIEEKIKYLLIQKDTATAMEIYRSMGSNHFIKFRFLNASADIISNGDIEKVDTTKLSTIEKGYFFLYSGIQKYREKEFSQAIDHIKKAIKILPTKPIAYQIYALAEEKRGRNQASYDILLEGVDLCPFSTSIYKSYILQCLSMGYNSFAKQALYELEKISEKEEFSIFSKKYQELIKKSIEF